MVETDYNKVKAFIDKAHAEGKAARFWGCPDTKTAWNTFMKLGLDYLNTDHPALLDDFLKRYPKNFYTSRGKFHEIYQPTYKNDGSLRMSLCLSPTAVRGKGRCGLRLRLMAAS